jgi:acyl-CoA reductase-like NAD-dependent aldehyde dehydrogenase
MMLPEFFRYNASLAVTFRGDTVPIGDGYLEYLHYSPIGVVGVMAPFNHPLLIAVRGIAPALAAGNTIVVKPSELTPLTTFLLAELALEAGLPPGVLNVVNGLGSSAGAALSSHANIARMEFTGGTETGRKVATEAAARLGSVTAELGGKTPVLVFNDADLDSAASGAAFAGFIAAGQSCVAGSRVIVQEAVADQFKERLVDVTEGIRVGDPLDTGTQMGPVISQAAKNRIVEAIDCAKSEGCEVLAGGSQPEVSPQLAAGFWVRPTVLAIKGEPAVTRTELFGPVISIETFGDEDEAVRIANNSDYGLGAAVWTKDVAKAHRVAQQIQSGMIWVNDHHRLSPAMPWGGMKQSGIGKQAGEESFRGFLEERSIIVRTAVGGPEWFADSGEERLN